MRHDLHHLATGYGTDMRGEAEISAWELRGGVRSLGLYTGCIVLSGALLGLLLAPIRTIRAWRANARRSLFGAKLDYEYYELLDLTVAQLRERPDVPEAGLNHRRHDLSSLAPADNRFKPQFLRPHTRSRLGERSCGSGRACGDRRRRRWSHRESSSSL